MLKLVVVDVGVLVVVLRRSNRNGIEGLLDWRMLILKRWLWLRIVLMWAWGNVHLYSWLWLLMDILTIRLFSSLLRGIDRVIRLTREATSILIRIVWRHRGRYTRRAFLERLRFALKPETLRLGATIALAIQLRVSNCTFVVCDCLEISAIAYSTESVEL